MSLPIRCFSCNNIIGNLELLYLQIDRSNEKEIQKFLKKHQIEMYCCRRIFLGFVPTRQKLLQFPTKIETNDKKEQIF